MNNKYCPLSEDRCSGTCAWRIEDSCAMVVIAMAEKSYLSAVMDYTPMREIMTAEETDSRADD